MAKFALSAKIPGSLLRVHFGSVWFREVHFIAVR